MKKFITTLIAIVLTLPGITAQSYFHDDFEGYTVNDYLGNSKTSWTTWSNSPGSSEDGWIVDNDYNSSSQSMYIESSGGNGPVDVVLPFGGVHNTGRFKFTSHWKIPAKSGGAYFNFQGDASVGSTWALDVYMYDDGTIQAGKYINSSYPQDQWFELVVDIDLTNNVWEMFIDGVSLGSWTNGVNRVSYFDLYSLFSGTSHWIDDVSFCVDNACASDISLDNISINPNPVCSNHPADVELTLTNNGPEPASGFTIGLDVPGQARVTRKLTLNNLAVGNDTTFTIPGMLVPKNTGSGISVSVINVTGDKDPSNDVASAKIDVLPSPDGFEIIKGGTFQGKFNIGDATDPDIVESGRTNIYDIKPGTGFSNSGYSSAWSITSIVAYTPFGVLVPPSAYSVTYPAGASNARITFKGSDTYMDSSIKFLITVKNVPNGCDSVVSRIVRVVPTPKLDIKLPASICLGDDVPFENKSTIHSGTVSYVWYFGDGDTSDFDNAFHQYRSAGTYNVRLHGRSNPWGIVRDTTFTIVVSELPNVKFKAVNKCEGVAVDFTNQSSVVNGTLTYDWDFGDGSAHSTAKDASHKYAAPGVYRVTLNANASGCIATQVRNAYTFHRPVANFAVPSTPVCSKSDVSLPNTSKLTSGKLGALWSFGDGSISTTTAGTHAYQTAGTYPVKLIAISEFECRDSITKTVTIKPAPMPDFVGNQYCGKNPTIFTNTTVEDLANPVYTWTFSDNYTSNLKNVTRSWPYEGPFSATLKADYVNGCSGTTTKDFKIFIQPQADFNVVDICSGETAKFVNKSVGDRSGMVNTWDFGNSTYSSTMQPVNVYNPSKTTTYTVTLVVAYPQACSDTARKNITVSEAPVCDFTTKDLGFMNTRFTPTNSGYSRYEWFFGEGGTATTESPIYTYDYTGNFNVTLRATNAAGCSCEVTKKVSATTAVNSVNTAGGISIYPNPNNGSFTVRNAENRAMKVEVFTVLGSKVYSNNSADGDLMVNLQDNARGIYLVKVTIDGVTSTSKVTVN
jgi:PKD repeat protein